MMNARPTLAARPCRTRSGGRGQSLAALGVLFICLALLSLAPASPARAQSTSLEGKRIFWAESYNTGNPWTDGIARGVEETLKSSGVVLEVLHMDTKSDDSPEFAQRAGERALEAMRAFGPDVVLASDDNAQRYFVVPYLKGGPIPVVFCGVNWDASPYGYPAPNVTGMVEVHLQEAGLTMARRYAAGDRVAYVAADTETERRNLVLFAERGLAKGWRPFLVRRFTEFLKTYDQAQRQADIVVVGGTGGIEGWDDIRAARELEDLVRIPSVSFDTYTAPLTVFTFAKKPEEQGQWMAATALRILRGESPADIPLVENSKADLIVNLKLAHAAGIVLPVSVLKTATVIGRE